MQSLMMIIISPALTICSPKAVSRKVIAPKAGSHRKVKRGDTTQPPQELIPPKGRHVVEAPKPHYNGLSTELPTAGGGNAHADRSG